MNRSKNKNEKPKFFEVEPDMNLGCFSEEYLTNSGSLSNNPTIEEILNPGDFGWGISNEVQEILDPEDFGWNKSNEDQEMINVDWNSELIHHDPMTHQEDVNMNLQSEMLNH